MPLADAPQYPPRRNRSFEDFNLEGRHALLTRLAYLVGEWPHRLVAVAQDAGLTRKPLTLNMGVIPPWYDVLADQFSQANGRRTYKRIPLVEHLDLEGIAQRRAQAVKPREQRRWEVLWHYYQQPEALPIARKLGVPWDFVARTVKRYNEYGPDWMDETIRAKVLGRGRLLSKLQEQELHEYLASAAVKPSLSEVQAWCEVRIGKRPTNSTIWMYRRGIKSHTALGRRAGALEEVPLKEDQSSFFPTRCEE